MEAATGVTTQASREALLEATPVTDFDLSMAKGSRNTANCYVVNGSGTYLLPLVYGNAVKNGDPNPAAYTSTKSGTNILTGFVNHLDDGISDPYIYNNPGCTPAAACRRSSGSRDSHRSGNSTSSSRSAPGAKPPVASGRQSP